MSIDIALGVLQRCTSVVMQCCSESFMSCLKVGSAYLHHATVLKLLSQERVEGVPVGVAQVSADSPEEAEDERGPDQWVQLHGILVQVRACLSQQQRLQQLTDRHHFTDAHLRKVKLCPRPRKFTGANSPFY